jgi:GcrA cell cycle regulator
MSWNDERVEALKKLWADGLSASQIAGRLGGVTRNAVIGKVHRLGLAGRATTSRMKTRVPRVRSAQAAKRLMGMGRTRPAGAPNSPLKTLYLSDTEPYVQPAEELVIPLNERKYIQTLTESCCRWPIGDPQQPDFHFCGRKKIPGLPYCEVHARRAFQPPQARRRERDFAPMVALPKVLANRSAPHTPEEPEPEQPNEKAAV